MNGMEKITARMEADAQRALEALHEETERQLAALREESETRAGQERIAAAEKADQAARERYERLCSAAEMETRKLTLRAQQEVLSEAYDLALRELCEMPEEKYLDLLVHLLKRAVSTGREEILLSQRDRDALGQELLARANRELGTSLTLSQKCAPIRAGFLLSSRECDVYCSFETLLALSRERTERGAAQILFAQ